MCKVQVRTIRGLSGSVLCAHHTHTQTLASVDIHEFSCVLLHVMVVCMHCLLLECYCATQEHVLKKCMIILRHDLKGAKGMNYFLFLFCVCAYM